MKTILKQVLLLCLLVTVAVCVGVFAACDNTTQPGEDTTVTYTVLVQDDNNSPVKGVAVYWSKGTTRYDSVTTGDDGKATMQLAPDTYSISFIASTVPDGYSVPESIQVTKDNTSVTVTLKKEFRYVVNLVNENGTPFYHENVMVAICQIDGSCLTPSPVGTDGKWYTKAEPDDYKVQISFPEDIKDDYTFDGYSATSHYYTGKLFSATDTEMTIVIRPVAKTAYTVTVVKPDNTPAENVYVTLTTSTASFTPVQTGADGKATIQVNTYGEYSVSINPPEGFAFDYGAYKTTEAEHELTVKLLKLNTIEFETEMTAEQIQAYGSGFFQFANSGLPLFYSFKNTFTANETKYFAFEGLKTGEYVIYCKTANTVFKICNSEKSDYTAAEEHTVSTNLAQGISVTKGRMLYFAVTAKAAGPLEFVIGTPDPDASSEITFTSAGTKEVTVNSAEKFATVYFTPDQSGIYEISSEGNFDTRVEYYANAITMFKTGENDDASATDKNFKLGEIEFKQVGPSSLFRVYVKEGASFPATFNVKIVRTGDAEEEITRTTQTVTPQELGQTAFPDGSGRYTDIDLSVQQNLVKGTDGFYHVGAADGPVLVVKLTQTFRNFGVFTYVQSGGKAIRATDYFMAFADYQSQTIFWDYTSFVEAYSGKCNADRVYGVNEELKTMLQRWAGQNINQYTFGIAALGTIADGNEWLIPCGYYSTDSTTPEPDIDDVILGNYTNEEEYILTVSADGTYKIVSEHMMGTTVMESGTWVKNSNNNYTFTYPAFDVTYTVTLDAQGTLTFMEDSDEPADEPYYVFKTDVIVGEYIFESFFENKTLTVNKDGTFVIKEAMGSTGGTWVKNDDGTYTFTEDNETLGEITYCVVRDEETGSLAFYDIEFNPDMEFPDYEFDVVTPDVIIGEYIFQSRGSNKTLSVNKDGTFVIKDAMGSTGGTWVKNDDGPYTFTENNETLGEITYCVVRDSETGSLTFYDIEMDPDMEEPAHEFDVLAQD